MIGILLVTHGRIGAEFVIELERILGKKQPSVLALAVRSDGDLDYERDVVQGAVTALDEGEGVLILTDIDNSTPANLARYAKTSDQVIKVNGLNMPMLVAAAKKRTKLDVSALADEVIRAGRRHITRS